MDVDLKACIEGSKAAWDAFVERTAPVIFAAVRKVMSTSDRAEIEDTVQDVYVRVLRNETRLLRRFDPARASLSTWLTLIARSTAIDALRRKHTDTLSIESWDAPAEDHPGRGSGPDIPLQLLTDRQRLVLNMIYEGDMSVSAIACMLDIDEQTVRSTKHKALERLREHFEADSG